MILFVFGTRPEAIKLAPLIHELQRTGETIRVCVTGQHREMLAQVLRLFGIVPDVDLDLMQADQELTSITAAIVSRVGELLRAEKPRLVVVQGDTTSAFAAGLAAFYAGVDVAHVEAGLRSGDNSAPWPEEVNRRLLSVIARVHFAPTGDARENLVREGVDPAHVHVTGNTVIDALQKATAAVDADARVQSEFAFLDRGRRLILVTGHRRESFGAPFEAMCHALANIAGEHGEVELVYPVHLNPRVQEPVRRILGHTPRIHLIEPIDYLGFVHLMQRCDFILTDSGGVQEEASALGKPVLVMRDTTERGEAVRGGNARLIGTRREDIVSEAKLLLRDGAHHARMSRPSAAFGDGKASVRIADILRVMIRG